MHLNFFQIKQHLLDSPTVSHCFALLQSAETRNSILEYQSHILFHAGGLKLWDTATYRLIGKFQDVSLLKPQLILLC